MATIPYNLIVKENNSDKFYNVLSEVTSIVTHRADQKFALELDKFIAYIESTRLETLRLRREYLIEMVLIGSLWNRYISNALPSFRGQRFRAYLGTLLVISSGFACRFFRNGAFYQR